MNRGLEKKKPFVDLNNASMNDQRAGELKEKI